MPVTDALIDKLCQLSMLRFDEGEREEIRNDLQRMIGFIDKLKEFDTEGVEPLVHMNANMNIYREDEPSGMATRQDVLENAPQHNGSCFVVPKVIKKPKEN